MAQQDCQGTPLTNLARMAYGERKHLYLSLDRHSPQNRRRRRRRRRRIRRRVEAKTMEWTVEIQKAAEEGSAVEESEQWAKHSIYHIPRCIKDLNPSAYTPLVVSFGPYHHGSEPLVSMEDHKLRALLHLLRRSGKPIESFAAAVRAERMRLIDAYERPEDRWRAETEAFEKMMIIDGCFMLEVLRAAAAVARDSCTVVAEYARNDPVFSAHGVVNMVPYIRRDMLLLENQLPLLLLRLIVSVENSKPRKVMALFCFSSFRFLFFFFQGLLFLFSIFLLGFYFFF